MKRAFAALGTGLLLVLVLFGSREEQPGKKGIAKLPAAIGAIHPRLSPDGSMLAFSYQGEIWTAPRTGGAMTVLSPGEGSDTEPAWSPDGKRIAFLRGSAVKLVEAATGKDIPLPKPLVAAGTYGVLKLEFSPDGKRLLGTFRLDGKDHGLAWFDLESGDIKPLTPVHYYVRFSLSPDGKWIALATPPDQPLQQGGNDGSFNDLWKMPAEGGPLEKICRFPTRIHDICWSGSKSLIVAAELGQAHDDLWEVPLDDSLRRMKKLTTGQADEDRPSTSRDGKWFAYTDNRSGPTAIIIRDTATGEESAVHFDEMDHRRPTGTLRIKTVDAATKQSAIARLSLKEDKGRFHAPVASLHRSLRGLGHFYCDGTAELTLPAGTYKLKGFRGPEYALATQDITIEAGKDREITIELERWVHMAKSGWWSGELHIHANYGYGQWFNTPETMRQQCTGEDLNVCNFMVANSDADVVFDRQFFRGGPDPLSTPEYVLYWNQEFRSTIWGHMTLVNLKQVVEPVFTGFAGTTNPWDSPSNSDVADRTHWQKGVVNYTHTSQGEDWSKTPYAAKSIPIDVALGKIDTLDINNSWAGSVPLWYRLMNCGFRVPATAGTDVFLNRIGSNLPGGDRVYVHSGKTLTYESWIDGLKAGKSFVTNGPMLEFTVNDAEPGAILKLGEKPKVRVKATARSRFPMTSAEVVHNGVVVAAAKLADDKHSATFDAELALPRGGWIAFRATGPGTADTPLGSQNAHTNPVYIEGSEFRSAADAKHFLKWIDDFELVIRSRDRFPTPKHRAAALEQLEAARSVYTKLSRIEAEK